MLFRSILLLIGEGELEDEIKAKVYRLGLDECVIFAGTCSNVNEMYQAMDVFVLPSRYEGLPVVGVEAQAAGLPCLFSINVTKETKLLNNVFFENAFDEYIEDVFNELNIKRINVAEKIKHAGFDIDNEADKLQNMYEELIK